jgi:hypothetical protein
MNASSGTRVAPRIAFCTGRYGSNHLTDHAMSQRATLQRPVARDRVIVVGGLSKSTAST